MKPEDEVLGGGLSDAITARDREQLHDLMDGRLTDHEAAAMHQRLEREPALRHALEELQQLGTWLRDEWDLTEVPALDPLHLADRVLARTLAAVPTSSLPHLEAPERLATWEFREATTNPRRFPWTRVSGFAAAAVVVVGATWFLWNQWTSSEYEHLLPPTRSEAQILGTEKARVEVAKWDSKVGAERAKAKDRQDLDAVSQESSDPFAESAEAGVGVANKQVEPTFNPAAEAQKLERPSVYSIRTDADQPLAEPPAATSDDDRSDEFFSRGFGDAWRGLGEFFGGAGAAGTPESGVLLPDIAQPATELDKLAEERLLRALSLGAPAELSEVPELAKAAEAKRALVRKPVELGRFEPAWREEDRQALREFARIVVDRYEVVGAESELDRDRESESAATVIPRLTVDQSHMRAAVAWNALQSEWTRLESDATANPQASGIEAVQADRGLAASVVHPSAAAEDVLLLKLSVEPGDAAATLGQTIESLGLRSIAWSDTPTRKARSETPLASEETTPVSELYLGWLNAVPVPDVASREADVALRFAIDPLIESQHAVTGSIVASATIQLALVQAVQEAEVDQWLVQADRDNGVSPRLNDEFFLGVTSRPEEPQPEASKKEHVRARAKNAAPAGPATSGAASRDLPSAPGAPATPTQRGTAGRDGSPTSPSAASGAAEKPAGQPRDQAPEPRLSAPNPPSAVKPDDATKALELRWAKAVRERVSARPLRVMVVLEKQGGPNSSAKKPQDK